MSYRMQLHTIMAAGTLALAACDTAPTDVPAAGPAFSMVERTVEESFYDLSDVFFTFSCDADGNRLPDGDGELVQMEGKIYERMTLLRGPNGEHHYRVHTMPVGVRGVGVTSGEEFRVLERDHTVANQLLATNTGTYRHELKLTGTDTRRTSWAVYSGNYRIDLDGAVTVSRDIERVLCRVQ